jgi:hypothetical protein
MLNVIRTAGGSLLDGSARLFFLRMPLEERVRAQVSADRALGA